MRKVTCYECGKHYNYDDDGFCPRCGAFNPPVSASRIAADGSVVWIDGLNERNHHNSFVHDELHEEDRERRRLNLDRDSLEKAVRISAANTRKAAVSAARGRKSAPALVWIIMALVIGVNLLLPLLAALFSMW